MEILEKVSKIRVTGNRGSRSRVSGGPPVLRITYGPQQFAKIRVVEVEYFEFPGEIFELV